MQECSHLAVSLEEPDLLRVLYIVLEHIGAARNHGVHQQNISNEHEHGHEHWCHEVTRHATFT